MGINIQSAKLMLHENNYKEIYGRVLIIGRNTVTIEIPLLKEILLSYGKSLEIFEEDIDIDTKASTESKFIRDDKFFYTISSSIKSVEWLDVSDYEGASIIADLNKPISSEFYGKYDFIYDGSVLDNVFNPAQLMENLALLLAPGGRICQINVTSAFSGALVCAMPEFFYGFYAANDFDDVKVYLAQRDIGGNRFMFPTKLWKYTPSFTRKDGYDYMGGLKFNGPTCMHTLCLAEKTTATKEVVYPKNLQYIDEGKGDLNWALKEKIYEKSERPDIGEVADHNIDNFEDRLFFSDHYTLIAKNF